MPLFQLELMKYGLFTWWKLHYFS